VDVLKVILQRIKPSKGFTSKHFVGHGCGKLQSKCNEWAKQLSRRGCTVLILIHDLDRNDLNKLHKTLTAKLAPCPIKCRLITIPVEELEAWLLSDPSAIQSAFSLRKTPHCPGNPETVRSPKEKLSEIVWHGSGKQKRYLNTIDNIKIAKHIQISALKRCTSFMSLHDFWIKN
jgi:hypothetical protein